MNSSGIDRVVEIADGQVSDLIGWDAVGFAQLWKEGKRILFRVESIAEKTKTREALIEGF